MTYRNHPKIQEGIHNIFDALADKSGGGGAL